MKPSEAAVILIKIAAYDRRTIGEADVEAWAEVMTKNHIELDDALTAVVDHFSTSTDFLMPIHIVQKVRANNRDWWQRVGVPPIPGELTWAQEKQWRKSWCAAIKAGDHDPVSVANEKLGISPVELPPNPEMAAALEALTGSSKAVR